MHFRVFSEGQGTEWRIFLGCLKFKYLFGVLEILDIFFFLGGGGGGGGMVDAWPEPTYEEKMIVPPPPPCPWVCPSVQTYPCYMHISGLLSFVPVGFCPVGFCHSGLLSYTP